jgi:hypothetical protein
MLCINVNVNTIVSGSLVFDVTRNGSLIGGLATITLTSGVTGRLCSPQFSTGSSSFTDTYGVSVQGSSASVVASPNMEWSTNLQLSEFSL